MERLVLHCRFLRPRQWPILTVQLAVGVLCAPTLHAALTGDATDASLRPAVLALAWLAWVLCLNGGTLAFNSAFDRDVEDVAYLRAPPPPPRSLAAFSLALMIAGLAPAAAVSPRFLLVVAACIPLSAAYSHPATRWKGIPGVDLAVNMVGYGGGTTVAGLVAGRAALGLPDAWPGPGGWWLAAGFCLLFGSFYPLTQLYQLEADRDRGDRTLAAALGPERALDAALGLGAGAAFLLIRALRLWSCPIAPLLTAMAVWFLMLAVWRRDAARLSPAQHRGRMYLALAVWALVDAAVLGARFAA